MAILLRLYQQDAEGLDARLTRPVMGVPRSVDATKDYFDHLRRRHDQEKDVSTRQKMLAASCLNLAAQSFQIGASAQGDPKTPPAPPGNERSVRPFVIFTTLMLALLLISLWMMSVMGVFSLFIAMVASILLNWNDVALLERRLWGGRVEKAKTAPRTSVAIKPTFSSYIEPIVRQIDEIIGLEAPPEESPPPPSLKAETLEFFQDMLEAKMTGDKDYAYKKISGSVIHVLSSEGIEVMSDVENHPSMFTIDTVMDDSKAGRMEAIRPALTRNAECILLGYAQRFLRAAAG
jgi:hypothetical protein